MKYNPSNAYDIAFLQNEDFTFKTIKNRYGMTGNYYSSDTVKNCFDDERINVVVVGTDGEIISQKYIEKASEIKISYNFLHEFSNETIVELDSEETIKI